MSCKLCIEEYPGYIDADGARCRCPNGCKPLEWNFGIKNNKEENMSFPVRPLADRIILKMIEKEETTKSGLVLPGGSSKFRTAEVIAVGRGVMFNGTLVPPEVNVGDLVHVTAHNSDELIVDGEKYHLVTERIIVAVVGHKEPTEKACCEKKTVKGAVLSETQSASTKK